MPNTPYLDPDQPLAIHHTRNLPHWDQQYKLQYITFRLADSLPQSKLNELKLIKEQFERSNPKPWTDDTTHQYYQLIGPAEHKLLDNGYGSCILKDKGIRDILSSSILFFDKVKYEVWAFVIMPNHVHMLIRPLDNTTIANCMHSIKSYSAKMINKRLNRTGKIWFKENFDRIVRSHDHLRHCLNYIIDNPRFLSKSEYELYVNPDSWSDPWSDRF